MSLKRKTPIRSRASRLSRGGKIGVKLDERSGKLIVKRRKPMKSANRKRRQSEFARCYHSRQRVKFVASLPCANCGCWRGSHEPWLRIANAHIEILGASLKADYDKVIPLCETVDKAGCHDVQHAPWGGWSKLRRLDTAEKRQAAAARTEQLWLAHRSAGRTQETDHA